MKLKLIFFTLFLGVPFVYGAPTASKAKQQAPPPTMKYTTANHVIEVRPDAYSIDGKETLWGDKMKAKNENGCLVVSRKMYKIYLVFNGSVTVSFWFCPTVAQEVVDVYTVLALGSPVPSEYPQIQPILEEDKTLNLLAAASEIAAMGRNTKKTQKDRLPRTPIE